MTELQMGLIGLGIVAVAGVLAYNKWQETRQRKQVEEALKASHPDVLVEGETDALRIEPELRPEPGAGVSGTGSDAGLLDALPGEDLRFLSPRVDFIASIDVTGTVPAQYIADAMKDMLAQIRKPIRWIGLDEAAGDWKPIPGQGEDGYRRIRAGLQLVDRQGLISGDDLAIFSTVMREMAGRLPARLDLPQWQEALDVAVDLDQFCASVDIQIGINVISRGQAFAGTKLRALAESAGMSIDGNGRFTRCDEEGRALFALLSQDAQEFSTETMRSMSTQALTFLLDVPCVAHGERVFDQMVVLAQRFAEVLHGDLVDDNRHSLSAEALEPIRQQIGQYQAMMAARQLPAGGPLARRLFS
jgi:hypothetical protein